MLKYLNIGNEALGYQGNDFFMALQFVINKARNSKEKQEDMVRNATVDIETTIAKYLNAIVDIRWTYKTGSGSVYSRVNTRQHALFQKAKDATDRNYFWNTKDIIDSVSFIGWVDPATGKLGGDYAKVKQIMLLNPRMVFEGDVEFAAAVIIHECGHIYTNAFFDGVMTVRSLALDWAYKELIKASDKEKVKKIIIQANKAMGLPPVDVVKLSEGEDRTKTFTVMAADITRRLVENDPLECSVYDRAEQMTDAYAIRHGAGEAILKSRMRYYVRQRRDQNTASGSLGALFAFSVACSFVVPPAGIALLFVTSLGIVGAKMDKTRAPTARGMIGALANEMVQIVKEGNLPPEDKKALLEDIDEADRNMKAVYRDKLEYGEGFTGFFARLIDKPDAHAEFNERLEDLSMNRLFVAAAKMAK